MKKMLQEVFWVPVPFKQYQNISACGTGEMIKDGELNFETQLKIEFLPPNNGSRKCFEKSLKRT